MDSPLFSIVTVNLNSGNNLLKTYYSVLSQKYKNFEYIIKDGGSSDCSFNEVRRESNAKTIIKPDNGIYHAMNQAIEYCKGEYIYFLNSGDVFYDNQVLIKIANEINRDSDILYGGIKLLPLNKIVHYPQKLTRFYLFKNNLNHQSWLVKKKIYNELGGFDLKYKIAADQHFLRKAILEKKVVYQQLSIVISEWEYGGYSTMKENRKVGKRERNVMLKEFYTPLEIFIYKIISLYFLNDFKSKIWEFLYSR